MRCTARQQGETWARKLKLAVTGLLLLSLASLTTACSKAPATGETIFTGGMTPEQEKSLGAQQHPQIIAAYGGVYEDEELDAYVTSLGNLLVATSELPDLDFTFTILDTPTVNAFALPGGYVYVTRGLLALANDEAELAGVMAHEIGHVTARHSAQRYGSNVLASVGQAALGAVLGGQAAQLGGAIAAPTLQSFSRQQEFEADTLGVRYLSRAGFDPEAMGTFLDHLQEKSRLEATLAGKPGAADTFDIMQTHPRTADRVEAAIRLAAKTEVTNPMRARDIYLNEINGLIYGDSPKQGFVRDRRFSHPELGFTFEVPEGYRLINSSEKVVARHTGGSLIYFDGAPSPVHPDPLVYLRDQWRKNLQISGLEKITINGMPAATATARVNRNRKPLDLRLLAIRFNDQQMFRFLFVTSPEQTAGRSAELRRTSYSFRKLSAKEIKELRPYRLDIRTAGQKTRLASEARKLPFRDFQEERLRVLNGMNSGEDLTPGQSYKMIVY
ncbi:M48 family metalloprotease [Rhodovibrionaceae bacterium A322]